LKLIQLKKAKKILIKGLVQGVGFRPFIFRTASKFGLNGTVENRNDGVIIEVEGDESLIEGFVNHIRHEAPPASYIESVQSFPLEYQSFNGFTIIPSSNVSDEITLISPDIAVCKDCLDDMRSQQHRLDYPFINCTNCGPRFTIIKKLPYDRVNTTMDPFPMCDTCREEYSNVLDRRFHAQPVACHSCGPVYTLYEKSFKTEELSLILRRLQELLDNDGIIAIKGMGGYFLSCDACSKNAVEKLRKLKNREGKPFAVMFADKQTLQAYAFADSSELQSITSWQRPILLLRKKKDLAWGVTNGFSTIGAMLPYMPFHYLMFEKIRQKVLVLTSGNFSDEPILIDDAQALEKFLPVYDAVLSYNREIFNRVDDSIVTVINKKTRLIRRSRGYAPVPVKLEQNVDGIVAAGAELVNSFCLGKGDKAFLSQHIGDLKNLETYQFYIESFNRFKDLFRVEPTLFVADLHPDYLSITFGAGGSTRDGSYKTVKELVVQKKLPTVAYIAGYGLAPDEIREVLDKYRDLGVETIFVIRGDKPKTDDFTPHPESFSYASELISFIKSHYDFTLGCAGYPEGHVEAESLDKDIQYLKQKVDNCFGVIV